MQSQVFYAFLPWNIDLINTIQDSLGQLFWIKLGNLSLLSKYVHSYAVTSILCTLNPEHKFW